MGKGSKPTIGFWYTMGLHMGLCAGPVDALLQITAGDLQAWSGSLTSSSTFTINQPDLFGGEKKEGGIVGTGWVAMGEGTQTPNSYLQSQLGTNIPAFRGLACVVFYGKVAALNPYVKQWAFQCTKFVKGWRTAVWQPSLAQVGKGQNAAHLLYRCVTDPVTGLGKPDSVLDLDKMLYAAQTLYNEGMGLCLRWTRSDVLGNFMATVANHIGGFWVEDPVSGKQYLKLLRADYDIDTAQVIDESNISTITSYQQSALMGSVNEVTVTYHDCDTNKDANITVHNLANVQAQGRVVTQTTTYLGLWSASLATRAAQRDLRSLSSLPAKLQCKVKSSLQVVEGDVLAFSWADLKISKMPMRVLEIDRGTATDKTISLTCAQDVYSLPTTSYVVGQVGLWQPPNSSPANLAYQRAYEATYRDIALRLNAADLAQVANTAGYFCSLGVEPTGVVAYNYTLDTRIGTSGTFNEVATGDFSPSGTLISDMPAENGPTTVSLANVSRLDQVSVGSEALIDNEFMRVTAIDSIANTATLARGCIDTLPAFHPAATRVWFTDGFTGADPTEYVTGETIQGKLLTRTSQGELAQASATTLSVVLQGRQALPYPPANLQLNGFKWYTLPIINGTLTLTWARRNRVTQADQLIDANAGEIAPDATTRYSVACYTSGGSLIISRNDIADNSSAVVLNYTGNVKFVVSALNNAGSSLQQYSFTVSYTPPVGTSTSSIGGATYVPADTTTQKAYLAGNSTDPLTTSTKLNGFAVKAFTLVSMKAFLATPSTSGTATVRLSVNGSVKGSVTIPQGANLAVANISTAVPENATLLVECTGAGTGAAGLSVALVGN